jgi:hypothetical protein
VKRKLKRLTATVALTLLIISSTGQAQSPSQQQTIEQLAKSFSEAYQARRLESLDAERPYAGKVKIVIGHSLGDDNSDETKAFRTLAQAERWLRSREIGDERLPLRESRPLLQCKNGDCEFDFDGGILHNHLYLQQISYGYRNGRPYIKTIYLLDGD